MERVFCAYSSSNLRNSQRFAYSGSAQLNSQILTYLLQISSKVEQSSTIIEKYEIVRSSSEVYIKLSQPFPSFAQL